MNRLLFALMFCTMASPALSHSWYSGKRDPVFSATTCCGNSDCGPLPPHAIRWTPDGNLRIVLSLEEARRINPMRIEPFDEVIPFDRLQVSEDGTPHICLMTKRLYNENDQRQGFFCVFLPPNG